MLSKMNAVEGNPFPLIYFIPANDASNASATNTKPVHFGVAGAAIVAPDLVVAVSCEAAHKSRECVD